MSYNELWSSSMYKDYYWTATDKEVEDTFRDYYDTDSSPEVEGLLDNSDYDGMRQMLVETDYDESFAEEDLTYVVAPSIKAQCYNDMFWVLGNYQRWDGGREAFDYFDDVVAGLFKLCYPNYDARTALVDADGKLAFTEATHDTPTGGTLMTFYSFKDAAAYQAAEEYVSTPEFAGKDFSGEELESFYNNVDYYGGDFGASVEEYATDFDAIKAWIDNGWLTPIEPKVI